MASTDKRKKKPKSRSGAAKSGARSTSVATRAPKGQKAKTRDTKGKGTVASRWTRSRERAKQATAARSSSGKGERRGFRVFLKEVRVELKKVTWPSRKDLLQSTIVVLVAVAIAGAYTAALDYVFQRLVELVTP